MGARERERQGSALTLREYQVKHHILAQQLQRARDAQKARRAMIKRAAKRHAIRPPSKGRAAFAQSVRAIYGDVAIATLALVTTVQHKTEARVHETRAASAAAQTQCEEAAKAKVREAKEVYKKRSNRVAKEKIKEKLAEIQGRSRVQWERSILRRLEKRQPWVAESSHAQAILVIVRSDATRRQLKAAKESIQAIDNLLKPLAVEASPAAAARGGREEKTIVK